LPAVPLLAHALAALLANRVEFNIPAAAALAVSVCHLATRWRTEISLFAFRFKKLDTLLAHDFHQNHL